MLWIFNVLFLLIGLVSLVACGKGEHPAANTPAVPAVTTYQTKDHAMMLEWPESPGATAYHLYRSDSETFSLENSVQVPNVTSPYRLVNQSNNRSIHYAVTALKGNAESEPSVSVRVTHPPMAPTDITANTRGPNVTLDWTTVDGASAYHIYWSTTSPITFDTATKIADILPPYIHENVEPGATLYYLVTSTSHAGIESMAQLPPIIAPPPNRPSVNDQHYSTDEDTELPITLKTSQSDTETLKYQIVEPPLEGSLSGEAPELTYQPSINYHGSDRFSYQVQDINGTSNVASVEITVYAVNDVPIAIASSKEVTEDSVLSLTIEGSDLETADTDLTYIILVQPEHGRLSGTAPQMLYTPDKDYAGLDSFHYQVSDGDKSSQAVKVNIKVSAQNDPPIAQPSTITLDEDGIAEILLAIEDVDTPDLTYDLIAKPVNGKLEGDAPNLTYTPNENFFGDDHLVFQVSDGEFQSDPAIVSLVVRPINDAPTIENQSAQLVEDTLLTFTLIGSDGDNDPLNYTIVTEPTHGTLDGMPPTLVYKPNHNYFGPDSLQYQVTDGDVSSELAAVNFDITPINDPPIIEARPEAIYHSGEKITLTAKAVDPEGDEVKYTWQGPQITNNNQHDQSIMFMAPQVANKSELVFLLEANDGNAITTASFPVTILPFLGERVELSRKSFPSHIIGTMDFFSDDPNYWMNVIAMKLHGQFVYMVFNDKQPKLKIIDVSNPTEPQLVGKVDLPFDSVDLLFDSTFDNYSPSSLENMSPRERSYLFQYNSPRSIFSAIKLPFSPSFLHIEDDYAFVEMEGKFVIIDINNTNDPKVIKQLELPGLVNIAVQGNHVYYMKDFDNLQLIDIKNPLAPESLGEVMNIEIGQVTNMLMTGRYLIIVDLTQIYVVDIESSLNPQIVAHHKNQDNMRFDCFFTNYSNNPRAALLTATKNLVVIIGCVHNDWPEGYFFNIINFSDPATIRVIPISDTIYYPIDSFAIHQDHFYLRDDIGLKIFKLTKASAMELLGSIEIPHSPLNFTGIENLQIAGNQAYLSYYTRRDDFLSGFEDVSGLLVVDVSHPTVPNVTVGNSPQPWMNSDYGLIKTKVKEDYSFSIVREHGFQIVDISTPAHPTLVSTLGIPGNMRDLSLTREYAYIAAEDAGLQIVDISNPLSPAIVGEFAPDRLLQATIDAVDTDGNYLYALTDKLLAVVNISNRISPELVGHTNVRPSLFSPEISFFDSFIYMTNSSLDYISVIDISSPQQPNVLKSGDGSLQANVSDKGLDLWLTGNIAIMNNYVYTGVIGGIDIWDVSDPLAMSHVSITSKLNGTIDTTANFGFTGYSSDEFDIESNYIYTVNEFGIQIIDVSDPKYQKLAGHYYLGTALGVSNIAISNNIIVLTTENGVTILEKAPQLDNYYSTENVNEDLSYQLNWMPLQGQPEQTIKCWTTQGECAITDIDQVAGLANVSWSLPNIPGDYEIVMGVGDKHRFITTKDRVTTIAVD